MKRIYIFFFLILLTFGGSTAQAAHAKLFDFVFNKQDVNTSQDFAGQNLQEEYKSPLADYASADDNDVPSNNNDHFSGAKNIDESQQQVEIQKAQIEKNQEIRKENTSDLHLTSKTVDFYTETSQYVAKGDAKLLIDREQLELDANEIIIDQRSYEIIGIGNVRILKEGAEYFGDYVKMNTKKESSYFKNPILYYDEITINAETATMHTNEAVAKQGSAIVKRKAALVLSTTKMTGLMSENLFKYTKIKDDPKNAYKIVAKQIIAKRGEGRTEISMKHATIYRGKYRVGYSPLVTFANDKDVNYVETIFPEIGSKERIGAYFAPAVMFGLPNSSTIKFGPLVSMDSDKNIGFGGFARLSTPRSISNFMYSTATNKFVMEAKYRFNKNLSFQFAGNEYMEDGWMGGNMPNYGAELVFDKTSNITQANVIAKNRLALGLFQDNKDYNYLTNSRTTMRYKWQMELFNEKPLLAWEKYLMLGYSYQHNFSLYQTGDTQGVLRVGPRLYTDLGRFTADITYYIGGQYGESPFIFDQYRYGRNNVTLSAQYYINKYLSIGYHASMNIGDTDMFGDWLTENRFIAAIGTEDLKLKVGFDAYRKSTTIGVDMLLGSNKTRVEFDEMKVKDFDSDMKVHKKSRKEKRELKKKMKENLKNSNV